LPASYSLFVGLESPILAPFRLCIVSLFLRLGTGCEMDAMKPQIIHQTSPKAHRNNIDWCCDDGVHSCCCCCVKPNTSNSWPNTNISESISWWQRRRKGANDKNITAAIRVCIGMMAEAVGEGLDDCYVVQNHRIHAMDEHEFDGLMAVMISRPTDVLQP